MGWENRGNQAYYYRKRRRGRRVVSEYLGSGDLAELAAQIDQATAAARAEELRAQREERAAQRAIDGALDAAGRQTALLLRAYLLSNGYHTHKGQWRRKRHE